MRQLLRGSVIIIFLGILGLNSCKKEKCFECTAYVGNDVQNFCGPDAEERAEALKRNYWCSLQ